MTLREFNYEKEPVVSIVKKILTDAINMKASDIHFDPTSTALSIKFRINGNLQEYNIAPESVKTNITTRIKILAGMNITDSMRPQKGAINFESEGKHHNMRVSSLPICDGEKIVVHISNYENNIKSLNNIGINIENIEKIKKLIKTQQGLILITGTNSSGKTTTMYAILKEINSKAINVISIEDPVKMRLDGINQVEISPDKGITYKTALKHVMLQDPNIICIDNLIDDEIARDAIRASITGRLVLSSLYTKTAYTTIDTLLNMDIENYLLGSNLNGIISQRLVKRLCPKCKEKKLATEYEKNVIKYILNKDINELHYPKGCEECHNGYINQIPIVEVIEINDEIRSAITNKKDRKTIRDLIYKNNNTIIIDGFNKMINGETSFNEIIRITDVKIDFSEEQKDIKEYILGNGIPTTEKILNDIQENHQDESEIIEDNNTLNEISIEESNTTSEEIIPEEIQVETEIIDEPNNEGIAESKFEETSVEIEENTSTQIEDYTPEETQAETIIIDEPNNEKIQKSEFEETSVEIEENTSTQIEDNTPEETQAETIIIDEPNNEEIPESEFEETYVEIEDNLEESNTTENITDETANQALEKQEIQQIDSINIPTPIEANVVEESSTPIDDNNDEDEDDDEDDFSYGEEYENTF